jgi:hypothetical protein
MALAPEYITGGAAIIAAIIGGLATIKWERFRIRRLKNRKYKLINQRIKIDAEIHGMLGVLLGITKSDRTYIYQFHPDASPIYFSCSYEEVKPGVSIEADNRQNLTLSHHTSFIQDIQEEAVTCCNVDTIMDKKIGKILNSQGVKTVCLWPIKNDNGYVIGFVGVDYLSKQRSIDCDIKTLLSNFAFTVFPKLASYEK